MSNDALELLRAANPVPGDLPAPPIDAVRARLQASGAEDRSALRRPHRTLHAAGFGAATLITVVIAVVAVVLLGHRPSSIAVPGSGGSVASSPVPADARPLVAILGVLRRPQTAAERSVKPPGGFRVISTLTRLATTGPNGLRIFMMVARTRPPLSGRGDLVLLYSPGPRFPRGVLQVADRSMIVRGAALAFRDLSRPSADLPLTQIVPDGVAEVRLVLGQRGHPGSPGFLPGTRQTLPQHGNVVVATVPCCEVLLPHLEWLNSSGQITTTFPALGGSLTPATPLTIPTTGAVLTGPEQSAGLPQGSRPVAQINLTPPHTGTKASGIAQVVKSGSTYGIVIVADHIPPNGKTNAYAFWLYNSPSHVKLLGFVNPGVGKNGRLSTAGSLPPNALTYTRILITLEHNAQPRSPGRPILQGRLIL